MYEDAHGKNSLIDIWYENLDEDAIDGIKMFLNNKDFLNKMVVIDDPGKEYRMTYRRKNNPIVEMFQMARQLKASIKLCVQEPRDVPIKARKQWQYVSVWEPETKKDLISIRTQYFHKLTNEQFEKMTKIGWKRKHDYITVINTDRSDKQYIKNYDPFNPEACENLLPTTKFSKV